MKAYRSTSLLSLCGFAAPVLGASLGVANDSFFRPATDGHSAASGGLRDLNKALLGLLAGRAF